MPPIRLALIGLSQSAKTSWASQAHLPYLLSPRGRATYYISGLLNSSVEAARLAIAAYKLDPETKAYASPEALAADRNVDLVVCVTRVDAHYDSVKQSLEAGKAVYIEWPLAENAVRAGELADAAKLSESPTIIGLQARVAPVVVRLKRLLESGQLGRVLSSHVAAYTPYTDHDSISEGLGYFFEKKVGGNAVTIVFGHMLDFLHSVLGEYTTSHTQTQIQRPDQKIVNRDTAAERPWTSDVPDLVSVHGVLSPSSHVASGATLSINFRIGPPFPGTLPFVWTLNCEKGEIRLSNERGPFLQSEASGFENPIEVHTFATGAVKRVDWGWEDWQTELPVAGRSIAKLYDLFAAGGLREAGCADFDAAVARHRQLDQML